MTYDVAALRTHFPSLASGIAHFDAPGGTQTPRAVGDAIASTLTGPLSNQGGGSIRSEANSQHAVDEFRSAFSDFLGVPPDGVVYGRSATALNYEFGRALAKTWGPGDEVVVSRLDHDANVRPWVQVAQAAGATVKWIDFDPTTAEVSWASVHEATTDCTRLVAVTGASNVLGTKPPLRAIADATHAVGGHLHVDAVHYAAHALVDLSVLGADSLVCSPYKFLGPHCAVLASTPEMLATVNPDKLAPSSNDVPDRFELGTLPFEVMAGASAAVDFLAGIAPGSATTRRDQLRASYAAIQEHEHALRSVLEEGLAGFGDQIVIHSKAADRTPTTLMTFLGRRTWDAYEFLAARDVLAPADSFYAYEVFRRLNLQDDSALQVGLAPYVDGNDVERLLDGLSAFLRS